METGRNVMHYALGDNQDYENEWSKAILKYLENGYSSEDSKSEVEVGNATYKILKREKVTVFYDADGNTLFDIENDRLKEEYGAIDFSESEPQSEMGKASLKEIAEGIPAPMPQKVEAAKENKDASTYIGVDGAVVKLQEELKKAKDKAFANPVVEHLIERCKESESLASDVCQDHKTWEKCCKYIYEQARKQAKGGSCAVRDDVVYEWAEDYYHKDDKAEEEKKAEAKEKTKKQMKKLDERADKARKKSEKKPTAKKPKEKAGESKPETKPQKNNKDMDGQLDMFSFFGM